ncbi:MerR family transcriptional regulator [Aquimarina sp. U1-2]|uniref:chaperone modulator CbpM n=1 Tax=Aquimarina sp. U1-2 TaxID=2823141 RepID=UPI001AEC9BCF|nr:chaperone modulator CbpM [Aquimarina sp. U1-2]MBP2831474.1 MerR family transcriptional regulator [Aquimarina sp. U1-2]
MTTKNLISLNEFCDTHSIEFSFINSLNDFGLIEVITVKRQVFIKQEELPKLEQILLFNKELDINLEGVEVIIRLLERVHHIQNEMTTLKNRLRLYEISHNHEDDTCRYD